MAELVGGAVVGAVIGELLKAILEMKDRTIMFKQTLAELRSTLEAIDPVIKEIAQHNKDLGRPKEELERLIRKIEEGTELVLACSKIRWLKRNHYKRQLEALDESLRNFFTIDLQAQIARDNQEILINVRTMLGAKNNNKPSLDGSIEETTGSSSSSGSAVVSVEDEASDRMNTFIMGPWGGNGGSHWDDGIYTGVREITLRYNDSCIHSILVIYDKQGQPFVAKKHGGNGGKYTAVIKLEYPQEFLMQVSGYYDRYVHSLTFKSNCRSFGPYGVEDGKDFSYLLPTNQEIVGFFGRSGLVLDSIGLHLSHAIKKDKASDGMSTFILGQCERESQDEASDGMNTIIMGPWGGNGGSHWDDGIYTGVREITLRYSDSWIHSIRVVYDKQGQPFVAEQNGGDKCKYIAMVKLEYPQEFLMEVSGHYNRYVHSLTFKSNRRTFGPYGVEDGKDFSYSLPPNQKIVGFLGRSGVWLDSIGLHLSHAIKKDEVNNRIKNNLVLGPWGGSGGSKWDDGIFTGVREIILRYDHLIHSVLVVYDKQGQPFKADKHGDGGEKSAAIKLKYPDEFLVEVSGHYENFIQSLAFKSNRRLFGPYGVEKGKPFAYSSFPNKEIVGFHGRSGLYLDSIGLHLSQYATEKAEAGDGINTFILGPWGGNGGSHWDDGIYTGVREITLGYNDSYIHSIIVVYDKEGQPFIAEKNGGNGGKHTATIKLEYPQEFLMEVTGHYDRYVHSLTFKSNRRTFGPYGLEDGKDFSYSLPPNQKIVGFLGRSGLCLDSIGLHLSYAFKKDEIDDRIKNDFAIGPWGGSGGSNWDDGIFNGVREIVLRYDNLIYSIFVVYDKQGQPFKASKHGDGGEKTAAIKLKYPEEYLVEISGYYDNCIRLLIFKSNRRLFGPYGVEKGMPFAYSSFPNKEIIGFHGRSGSYLHSIGLHLSQYAIKKDRVGDGMKDTFILGPCGGNGGSDWDDGIFNGVRGVTLQYDRWIHSILMVYDQQGHPFKAERKGHDHGKYIEMIELEYPDEFFIEVSGHYSRYIQSLTFKSNRRTFGPYGVEEGTSFTYSSRPNQEIVGFLGRSGLYLDSIGLHLTHAIKI